MNTQQYMILAVSVTSALAGFTIGYWRGEMRGKALGWCEHYMDTERANRERRDRHGRFVAAKAKAK